MRFAALFFVIKKKGQIGLELALIKKTLLTGGLAMFFFEKGTP